MPERLTESLSRRGLLDAARAREAMQRQVLLGGALDTCLLELNLVDEPALLDAMASAYGLATATTLETLAPVDVAATRAFPEQWAKKHTIAPVSLDEEGAILTVISPAPADVNLLVRLGELLELTIKPLLAPEFRVHQRIALLYEDKPPERFRALIERIGGPMPSGSGVHARPSESAAPVVLTRPLTFGEAISRLKESRTRDDIVHTALAYAHRELEFAAMFRVHDQKLEGWNAVGDGAQNIQQVALALAVGSAFRVVLDTQAHYLGPLPSDELHQKFLEKLGRPHPRAALIVPVRIKNRTVALMYGENGPRTIPPRLAADLMLFTTHVQGALEALLLRRKTETLSEPPARDPAEAKTSPPSEAKPPAPAGDGAALSSPPAQASPPMPVPSLVPEPQPRRPSSINSAWPSMIPSPVPMPRSSSSPEMPVPLDSTAFVPAGVASPEEEKPAAARIDLVPARAFELPLKLEEAPSDATATAYAYVRRNEPFPIASDEVEREPARPAGRPGGESTDELVRSFLPVPAEPQPLADKDDWDNVEIVEGTPRPDFIVEDGNLAPEPTPTVPGRPPKDNPSKGSIESVLNDLTRDSSLPPIAASDNGNLHPPASKSEPEGWDAVQVDSWDEWANRAAQSEAETKRELRDSMRASLIEDSTIPDLSAEAWLRASSDSIRAARPLPAEVVERAALDAPEEPVPLTQVVARARVPSRPIISAEAEDAEPVPLVRPSAVAVRAEAPVLKGRPLEAPLIPSQGMIDFRPEEVAPRKVIVAEEMAPAPAAMMETATVRDSAPPAPPAPLPAPPPTPPPASAAHRPAEAQPPQPRSTPLPAQLETEVNYLVDALNGGDTQTRRAARDALTAMGPFVLPRLMERFPGPLAIDPFAQNAVLPAFAECGELLSILASFGLAAHPHVVRRLDGPDPSARFFATYFYAVVFVPDAIPRLLQRLHDEEPRICMLAARTLFSYRELPEFHAVIEHLHGRLEATSIAARRHAAYLVGLFRDVTAVPILIEVFEKKEKMLFDAAEGALAEITKQMLGPNPKKWRAWWAKNQKRSRIGWLVEGLSSKESALRRSAAEELKAVTGLDFGYSEDAPKREREDARMKWVKWWTEQEGRLGGSSPAAPG